MRTTSRQHLFPKKTPVVRPKFPTCHTCKSSIDDPTFRFLIIKDEKMKHELLSFHYFFPCWDMHYIFKNLEGYEIFKAGFSCDASILKNPKYVNNLRKNPDLWEL